MTDVVSYRTEYLDELKEISKARNISPSTLSTKIIESYIKYFQIIEEQKYVSFPRQIFFTLHNCLDESKFDMLVKSVVGSMSKEVKYHHEVPSFEILTGFFKNWFDYNGFLLRSNKKDHMVRFVCQHDVGKNWSKIAAKVMIGLYQTFGFSGSIEETAEDFFSFQINSLKS